jgi:hypothetical protein
MFSHFSLSTPRKKAGKARAFEMWAECDVFFGSDENRQDALGVEYVLNKFAGSACDFQRSNVTHQPLL